MTTDFKKGPVAGKTHTQHVIAFARLESEKLAELYLVYNNAYGDLQVGTITKEELAEARKKMMEMFAPKTEK